MESFLRSRRGFKLLLDAGATRRREWMTVLWCVHTVAWKKKKKEQCWLASQDVVVGMVILRDESGHSVHIFYNQKLFDLT